MSSYKIISNYLVGLEITTLGGLYGRALKTLTNKQKKKSDPRAPTKWYGSGVVLKLRSRDPSDKTTIT